MFCKKCGSQLPESAEFCSNCGAVQKTAVTSDTSGKENIMKSRKPFKPFGIKDTLTKFRYPFLKDKNPVNNMEFTPRYTFINENSIEYQAEVEKTKLTFHLLHGLFILLWYCLVLGCYCYYIIGYCIYWLVSSIFGLIKKSFKK